MKKIDRYLLDLKIDLSALKRPTDITKVSFLVDRRDFLDDVKKYRDALKIQNLISRKELQHWHYLDILVRKDLDITHEDRIKRNKRVRKIVETLMQKYKRETPEYWQVIFSALLSGKVIKTDLENKVYPVYTSDEAVVKGPQTLLAVFPNTTQDDLANALKSREVQYLLKQQEQSTHQRKDAKWNEIKKVRKWYWQNIKGLSYSKIAELEPSTGVNTVSVMLSRYKRALSKPLD